MWSYFKPCKVVEPEYLTEVRKSCRFVLEMAHAVFLIYHLKSYSLSVAVIYLFCVTGGADV